MSGPGHTIPQWEHLGNNPFNFGSSESGDPYTDKSPDLVPRYYELKKGISDSEYLTDEERQKFANELTNIKEESTEQGITLNVSADLASRYGADKDPNKRYEAIDAFLTELNERLSNTTEIRRKEKEKSMDIREIQKAVPGFYQAESVNTGTALTRK